MILGQMLRFEKEHKNFVEAKARIVKQKEISTFTYSTAQKWSFFIKGYFSKYE